jgi:GNAT superfamily N-acetyltransferase
MSMFRAAGTGDLESVLALQREYYAGARYPHHEADARRALGDLLESPSLGAVWLAEDGSGVFAYVVLTLGYSLEYGGADAFVDELFVRSSHRGRGVGRAALERVEAECRRRGVRALHLEVELDKPEAFALYRRSGFEEHGRRLMTRLVGV